ncbi:MAG: sirohydrochlorin cobaltochelatase [Erysipelotrichaceae bacterium]|nr:sirohydrochlorin cobaltochelatase [Erysipelotrichaceae bacterium]
MLKNYDAVVLACFGTGRPAEFEKTFYKIYQGLVKKLNKPCFLALTSTIFLKTLNLKLVKDCLNDLKEEGYKDILIVPLIMADGVEYQRLLKAVDKDMFDRVDILEPILKQNRKEIVSLLNGLLIENGERYLLLGHGSKLGHNEDYFDLLKEMGRGDIKLSFMHDEIDEKDFLVFPLFISRGHHYLEFMEEHPEFRYSDQCLGEMDELIEIIYKGI